MPGSHGSLTKSGKVRFGHNVHMKKKRHRKGRRRKSRGYGQGKVQRDQAIERDYRPKSIPRLRNRRNYTKRILLGKAKGQETRRRRRR